MRANPFINIITIEFSCQFRVEIRDSSLATILTAFSKLLPQILTDFIQKVLVGFGESEMGQTRKPFRIIGIDTIMFDKRVRRISCLSMPRTARVVVPNYVYYPKRKYRQNIFRNK